MLVEVLFLVQNTYHFLQSYDYDGENVKLDGKLCAYLKRGIGFKARGFDCTDPMDYYCLWTRKYSFYPFLPSKKTILLLY